MASVPQCGATEEGAEVKAEGLRGRGEGNKFSLAHERSVSDWPGVLLPKCKPVTCQVWGRCPEQGEQSVPVTSSPKSVTAAPSQQTAGTRAGERSGAHVTLPHMPGEPPCRPRAVPTPTQGIAAQLRHTHANTWHDTMMHADSQHRSLSACTCTQGSFLGAGVNPSRCSSEAMPFPGMVSRQLWGSPPLARMAARASVLVAVPTCRDA